MLAELWPGAGSAPAKTPLLTIRSTEPSHRAELALGLCLLGRLGGINAEIGFCIGLVAVYLGNEDRGYISFWDLLFFYRDHH